MGKRISKGTTPSQEEQRGDVGLIRSQGAGGREMQRQQRSVSNRARQRQCGPHILLPV